MTRLMLFLAMSAFASGAADYYIGTSGNDSTGDGSLSTPWRTFSKGMTNLTAGDTLYVVGGPFTDANDFINQAWLTANGTDFGSGAITIAGYGGSRVTVQPTGSGNIVRFDQIADPRHHIIVSNFTFNASSRTAGADVCKISEQSYAIKLDNCGFTGASEMGIHLTTGGESYPSGALNWVTGCEIWGVGLDSQDHGIYVRTQSNTVEHTTFRDISSGYGVHSNDSLADYNIYRYNYFTNISARAAFILAGGGNNNLIHNNIGIDVQTGIRIYDERDSQILNNSFWVDDTHPDANYGLQQYLVTFASSNIVIRNNLFIDCFRGISISSGTNCIVENNATYNNTSDYIYDTTTGGVTTNANIASNSSGVYTNVTLVFPPNSPENFQLKAGTASIGAGQDLSATFTTDYGGNTRVDWDIGAWAYTADDPGGGGGDPSTAVKRRGKIPGLGRGRGSWR